MVTVQGQSIPNIYIDKKNTKQLVISLMLFHPQTPSHLLSQLFVTHLSVDFLFYFAKGPNSGAKAKIIMFCPDFDTCESDLIKALQDSFRVIRFFSS